MTRKQCGLDLGPSLDCRLCPSTSGNSRQHSAVRARASSSPRFLWPQNSRAHLIKTTAPKHRLALYNMSRQVKASVAETAGIWIGQQSCTWLPTAAVVKLASAIASGWPRTHCVTRAHSLPPYIMSWEHTGPGGKRGRTVQQAAMSHFLSHRPQLLLHLSAGLLSPEGRTDGQTAVRMCSHSQGYCCKWDDQECSAEKLTFK